MMSDTDPQEARYSLWGALIATGLTLYAIRADRRRRRMTPVQRAGNGRYGRHAEQPQQIPAAGWWSVLKRVLAGISRNNLSLMAAGIAFYSMFALTPAFTALVSLYGLMFDPGQVEQQVSAMEGMVPAEARNLIAEQLTTVVRDNRSRLGTSLVVSLTIALWSTNSGTIALMSALNVAYVEEEKRRFLTYWAHSLLLTAALVVFGILSLVLVAVIPVVIGVLPLGDFGKALMAWVRWPVLFLLSTIGLAVIYRYAPSRNEPRWSWVSWGAAAATMLWLLGSALFSAYVGTFATYNKTYGSLGAVVVLLMWFWLSAFAVLLGAKLNAEMELQTARDTTGRPAKPLGRRGAFVADRIARRS